VVQRDPAQFVIIDDAELVGLEQILERWSIVT